ncbi:MAG: M23 family metallopeptidase [Bdellovibrionales bacterium]|nr:M23 family metallopeptidase [Bdellovibrionales bacterium]
MKVLKISIATLVVALLVPPVVKAGTLVRYTWSDAKGLAALDPSCQVKNEEKVSLYVAQKPGASLNSSTKLKGLGFFSGLIPSNLLDRSVLFAKNIPADATPATVQVVSVPQNVVNKDNLRNLSKRGDEGTLAKETLQEIGNFVLEVMNSPVLAAPGPFQLKQSYWQAAMDNEHYITLSCGDVAKPTTYIVFDVYDSKGIDPIAQVGITGTDTKVLEDLKVMTPDEANQEAIGEAPAPTPPPANNGGNGSNGGTTTPGDGTTTPGNGGVATPDDPDKPVVGEEDEGQGPITPPDGTDKPGLGYVVCTIDKSIPVFDKELKPVGHVDQFEIVIPNQTWDEKQKSSYLEVQFPNRKDVTSGWLPRSVVQTTQDCEPYKKKHPNEDDGIDYSTIPLDASVSRTDCCKFPTIQRPSTSYAEGKTRFRAGRAGGRRLHAGVDLYRKKGEPAVAVASGRVIRGHYYFYQGVFAIEVKHPLFIARYGEVLGSIPKGALKGQNVVAGQTVGLIGKVNSGCCTPMLHFELYKGTSRGPLTRYRVPPYDRRPDVMDPTDYVRKWEKSQYGKSY